MGRFLCVILVLMKEYRWQLVSPPPCSSFQRKKRQAGSVHPIPAASQTVPVISQLVDITNGVEHNTTNAETQVSINEMKSKTNRKRELRLVIMAAILLTYFTLSFSPFFIFAFTSILCSTCKVDRYIRSVLIFSSSLQKVSLTVNLLKTFPDTRPMSSGGGRK